MVLLLLPAGVDADGLASPPEQDTSSSSAAHAPSIRRWSMGLMVTRQLGAAPWDAPLSCAPGVRRPLRQAPPSHGTGPVAPAQEAVAGRLRRGTSVAEASSGERITEEMTHEEHAASLLTSSA